MRFKQIQYIFFFLLLGSVSVAFLWIIHSFLASIFWAGVLAIVFYPIQRWWEGITGNRQGISAVLSLLSVVLIVLIPLLMLGYALVQESLVVYQKVSSQKISVTVDSLDYVMPFGTSLEVVGFTDAMVQEKISSLLYSINQYAFSQMRQWGQNTLRFFVDLLILLYVLYFFFKDGPALVERMMHLSPLGKKREKRLLERFVSTCRATIKGTLIIGVIQGLIGGILFWFVGIPAPLLWGAVMTVLSLIPVVGSFIVWAPVGVFFLVTGNLAKGIVVLGVGMFIIGLVDNILRPPLVGKDTKMPEPLILLSTLGGISALGISGFIVGPVIAAFFISLWEMFEREYHWELLLEG